MHRPFIKSCLAVIIVAFVQHAFAADLTVNTFIDESDGSCSDGDCSIRDAIAVASSGDQISIPAGTYTLSLGQLSISKDLTLTGAGAQQTIIDANDSSRLIELPFSGSFSTVTIEKMSLINGSVSGTGRGGGVRSDANLILRDCVVRDSSGFNGGGVVADNGSLRIVRCAIQDNQADGNSGGGVIISGADFTLLDSTVTGNSAFSDFKSGVNSVGGGLAFFSQTNKDVLIRNSSIIDNSAEGSGGGIYISSFDITNSPVNISNSVIANNGASDDCDGLPTTLGFNADSDDSCGFTAATDLAGIDPKLGSLALNGAGSNNFLPNADSPLIDAGNPASLNSGDAACTVLDQSGKLRAGNGRCDIGSMERDGPVPRNISGTVSGLTGEGLVLQNNGGDDLAISGNGSFTFATPLGAGDTYSVSVKTQPTAPVMECGVSNSTGTVAGGDINDVQVTCTLPAEEPTASETSLPPEVPIPVNERWSLLGLLLCVWLIALRNTHLRWRIQGNR